MASFFEETLTTSTVGVAGAAACGFALRSEEESRRRGAKMNHCRIERYPEQNTQMSHLFVSGREFSS